MIVRVGSEVDSSAETEPLLDGNRCPESVTIVMHEVYWLMASKLSQTSLDGWKEEVV
jgi:hypothetical protein